MDKLEDALKNCLKLVKKQTEIWSCHEKKTMPHVKSVINLLEQINCCKACKLSEVHLGKTMVDIEEKLLIKLKKSIQLPLSNLKQNIDVLRRACQKICSSYLHIEQLLEKQNLSAHTLSSWGTTKPPLSLVLLGIKSLIDSMQQALLKRECFLVDIRNYVSQKHDDKYLKAVMQSWDLSDNIVNNNFDDLSSWCQFMV